jgi:uncharacterized membrane protein
MYMPSDWEIKKCLGLALAILLANLGLVVLAASGLDIPILRQIVGFIFLTFIPGILILRILKIHNIGAIESLLYSVGLSIAFVMFTGLFANFVLPLIGVSKPISLLPITATLGIFTLILGAVAYKRDRDFAAEPKQFNIAKCFSPPYLFLLALPLLAILGAHLVNLYQNNFLLLFFIIVICCVVAMVVFDWLPKDAYPLAIVMIGLSLLLHVTLISNQLSGYDIHLEYYFQNLVAQSGYWNFTIPHDYNTALSVVLLCPVYSCILNMNAIWVFKIVYPLIFCLVPLALFHIFREQIGNKKAFLSAFFFMSIITFFTEMTAIARQQIAELFLALLTSLLIDRKLALNQRGTLVIIFAVSLIVSHYALGYICMAFLVVGWGIWALIRSRAGRRAWGWLTHKFGGLPQGLTSQGAFPHKIMALIVGIYLVFALGWYGGIAQGAALAAIKDIVHEYSASLLSTELTDQGQASQAAQGYASQATLLWSGEPSNSGPSELSTPGPGKPDEPSSKPFDIRATESLIETALGLDFTSASPLGKTFRIFQYLTQLFIVIGFCGMIFKPKRFKFRAEFIALSIVAALILFACIVIPGFSTYLGATRFYHIALFFLAPFCIIGGEAIWQRASRLSQSISSRLKGGRGLTSQPAPIINSTPLRLVVLGVLIPYFIFTSGLVSEISGNELYPGDIPHSLALSSSRLDMPVFNDGEAEAVAWLARNIDGGTPLYGDEYGRLLVLYERLFSQTGSIPASGEIPEDAYVFFRTWNIEKQEMLVVVWPRRQRQLKHVGLANMTALLDGREVIYDNGNAQIWAPR